MSIHIAKTPKSKGDLIRGIVARYFDYHFVVADKDEPRLYKYIGSYPEDEMIERIAKDIEELDDADEVVRRLAHAGGTTFDELRDFLTLQKKKLTKR